MLADDIAPDVLHALAVKGMVTAAPLSVRTGRDEGDVSVQLDRIRAAGLATHLERRGLWRITEEGRSRHTALLDRELSDEARDRLRSGYERFLPLNRTFKELCTRWQRRAGAHGEGAAQEEPPLIAELAGVHREATDVLEQLARARAHFGRYAELLGEALRRLNGGEERAFTGVMCDSYHDVWMELHRDLLLSLKVDRETEERPEAAR